MPLVVTPAIVLSSLRYSETSKIIRVATREHGVQSAIAKGALRPRSRFGAALQLLSDGVAHLVMKEHRDLHLLTAFDVTHVRIGLAGQLDRYAAASSLAEVMLRFAPPDPHPDSFDLLRDALDLLERVEPERVFAFRWHPYAVDQGVDYSGEPTTLVEFLLEAEGNGTLLTLTESGFNAIPQYRRAKAFEMNDHGWGIQVQRIKEYVSG